MAGHSSASGITSARSQCPSQSPGEFFQTSAGDPGTISSNLSQYLSYCQLSYCSHAEKNKVGDCNKQTMETFVLLNDLLHSALT